jgi:hypothetical protein
VLTANGTEIDLKGHITVDSIIGNGQCPADVPLQVFGKTVVFKLSEFCRYFNAMGMLLFLSTSSTCLRILGLKCLSSSLLSGVLFSASSARSWVVWLSRWASVDLLHRLRLHHEEISSYGKEALISLPDELKKILGLLRMVSPSRC